MPGTRGAHSSLQGVAAQLIRNRGRYIAQNFLTLPDPVSIAITTTTTTTTKSKKRGLMSK